MGYIIPVKIRHMSEPVSVSVCEILRTVKYAHQDDVMVIGLKARNITN